LNDPKSSIFKMEGNNLENVKDNCVVCNRKSPLFKWLSDDELNYIRRNKQTIWFNKGETIRKQGTSMNNVISVNSGMAKLYLEGIEHRNVIVRIVKATNFIGGPGLYLDQQHHFTVVALVDTIVCFIDLMAFKEVIATNRMFHEEFMKDFSRSILSVYNRIICLTQKQIPGRMADTLIYLMDEIFGSSTFEMILTRQDLADLSAMSKDSADKVLRQFENDKIIKINSKRLEIADPESLKRISKLG
jgi:CRP/FNR family transcriptional regulator, polysaccharide utilization system transcription regulator